MNMDTDVVRALGADRGLFCVVGAGGKKTTLYALADRLQRAVVTATVRIPIFDREVERVVVTDDPLSALRSVGTSDGPLGLVSGRQGDRYLGYDLETAESIAAEHDGPVLVKADGARTREFKAPGKDEPRLPRSTNVVAPIASVAVVGRPLGTDVVHRPERVAALTGLDPGDPVTPAAVATVLAHPRGGLKGVPPGATVIPLLNKVDDGRDRASARQIARNVFQRTDERTTDETLPEGVTIDRIVLARMIEPTVVDVVGRDDVRSA